MIKQIDTRLKATPRKNNSKTNVVPVYNKSLRDKLRTNLDDNCYLTSARIKTDFFPPSELSYALDLLATS